MVFSFLFSRFPPFTRRKTTPRAVSNYSLGKIQESVQGDKDLRNGSAVHPLFERRPARAILRSLPSELAQTTARILHPDGRISTYGRGMKQK